MKKIVAIVLMLLTSSVLAQEKPKFVPYTITEEDHIRIMNYLLEQPARMAIPLISILNNLQQKATKEEKK